MAVPGAWSSVTAMESLRDGWQNADFDPLWFFPACGGLGDTQSLRSCLESKGVNGGWRDGYLGRTPVPPRKSVIWDTHTAHFQNAVSITTFQLELMGPVGQSGLKAEAPTPNTPRTPQT